MATITTIVTLAFGAERLKIALISMKKDCPDRGAPQCSKALGFLRESPLLARAAATYLEQQLTKEFTGE